MKTINPYLSCNGQAREAMTHYHSCFGGDLSFLTVGESPMADQMSPDMAGLVMHSALVLEGGSLMATDMGTGESSAAVPSSVAIDCSSAEELNRFFEKLSEGGSVTCPPGPAFWGGSFGAVTDRFGITWMLTHNDSN